MRIEDVSSAHNAQILRMNREFVHWLAPMTQTGLDHILGRATYARQINDASGVLIGYAHDQDYPNHENLKWLKTRLDDFFYIDRIIIDRAAQGKGLGLRLYADVEAFARRRMHPWLACEVNIIPDNPASHRFHLKAGFQVMGEQVFSNLKGVRYYAKTLKPS
jgi:predicted GNAT superfamily acetyltransferase